MYGRLQQATCKKNVDVTRHESIQGLKLRSNFIAPNYSLITDCVRYSKEVTFGYPDKGKLKEKTTSDGLFLQPSGTDNGCSSFSPMGTDILNGNITLWCPGTNFTGLHYLRRRQVEWTQLILHSFKSELCRANIYGAVFCSLFSYKVPTMVLKAFLEGWNKTTHTCLVRDGEISISLWDLKHISGLPINGDVHYDEYNPFEIDSSVQQLYDRYFRLIEEGRSKVSGDVWISTWFNPDEAVNIDKAPSRDDPFSIKAYGNRFDDPYWKHRNRQHVSADVFLASFLAFWLSVFVLPSDNGNVIRPETFVMAYKMARGIKVSLAVSVLSLLYESFDLISQSQDPNNCEVCFPVHYMIRWMGLYFPRTFTCPKDDPNLPLMTKLADLEVNRLRPHEIRMMFRNIRDGLMPDINQKPVKRGLYEFTSPELSDLRESILVERTTLTDVQFEFLVNIRPCLLPYRRGNEFFLNAYNPSRFARQFGFDQDIPSGHLDRPVNVTLYNMLTAWSNVLYKGSRCNFVMPARKRQGLTSYSYALWYRKGVDSYLNIPLSRFELKTFDDPPSRGHSTEAKVSTVGAQGQRLFKPSGTKAHIPKSKVNKKTSAPLRDSSMEDQYVATQLPKKPKLTKETTANKNQQINGSLDQSQNSLIASGGIDILGIIPTNTTVDQTPPLEKQIKEDHNTSTVNSPGHPIPLASFSNVLVEAQNEQEMSESSATQEVSSMTNPYEDEVDYADDDEVIAAFQGTGIYLPPPKEVLGENAPVHRSHSHEAFNSLSNFLKRSPIPSATKLEEEVDHQLEILSNAGICAPHWEPLVRGLVQLLRRLELHEVPSVKTEQNALAKAKKTVKSLGSIWNSSFHKHKELLEEHLKAKDEVTRIQSLCNLRLIIWMQFVESSAKPLTY